MEKIVMLKVDDEKVSLDDFMAELNDFLIDDVEDGTVKIEVQE